MGKFKEAARLIANIDWSQFLKNELYLNDCRIDSIEIRKEDEDIWFLNTENDGYHVAASWQHMHGMKKDDVIAYLKTIQKRK